MIELGKFNYDKPKCPKCQSSDLDYSTAYEMGETIKKDIRCNSCRLIFYIYIIQPRYWELWANDNFFHMEVEKS